MAIPGGGVVARPGAEWSQRLTAAVGAEIQRRRKALGLLGEDLAQRCLDLGLDLPKSTISKIETGTRAFLSTPELLVLAAALRTTPDLLLAPISSDTEMVELLPGWPAEVSRAYAWLTSVGGTAPGLPFNPEYAEPPWGSVLRRDDQVRRVIEDHLRLVSAIQVANGALMYTRKRRREAQAAGDDDTASELSITITEESKHQQDRWEELLKLRGFMRSTGLAIPSLPRPLAEREASNDPVPWGLEPLSEGDGDE